MAACEVMHKHIKSQGRGGRTGSSCEVMLACEGMTACKVMQKHIDIFQKKIEVIISILGIIKLVNHIKSKVKDIDLERLVDIQGQVLPRGMGSAMGSMVKRLQMVIFIIKKC